MDQIVLTVHRGDACHPWRSAISDLTATAFSEPTAHTSAGHGVTAQLNAHAIHAITLAQLEFHLLTSPDLVLITAHAGSELVGFTFGAPLRPDTRRWTATLLSLPAQFTAEDGSRTYQFVTTAVHPSWRGLGLGRRILDTVMTTMAQVGAERITLDAQADSLVAQMYRHVGCRSLGQPPPMPGRPPVEILVLNVADYRR